MQPKTCCAQGVRFVIVKSACFYKNKSPIARRRRRKIHGGFIFAAI